MKTKKLICSIIFSATLTFASHPPTRSLVKTDEQIKKAIIHKIQFKDGQSLTGTIISQDETQLELKLGTGNNILLSKNDITSITQEKSASFNKKGELIHKNSNSSRYLWAPSAFMLDKGEAIFSQKQLFFSSLGYGLTNNLNIQVGSVIPYWFVQEEDENGSNFILSLKAGGQIKENLNASFGFQNFAYPGFGANIFMPFANFTIGNPNKNITIGYASPIFNTYTDSFGELKLLNVSAFVRLNKRFGLISENHFITLDETYLLGSIGTRIMWEKLSADIGLFFNPEISIPLPWLGISYSW